MIAKIHEYGGSFVGRLGYAEMKAGAELVGSNMCGRDHSELAREFAAQAETYNGRGKSPCFHASLSAAPGEQISAERWHDIARDYLRGLDMDPEKHQYCVYLHTDRDHQHAHIVANRVDENGQYWSSQHDQYKSAGARRALEKKYGLENAQKHERKREFTPILTKNEIEHAARLGVEHPKSQIARRLHQAFESCDGTRAGYTHAAEAAGVDVRWNTTRTGKTRGYSAGLQEHHQPKGFEAQHYPANKIAHGAGWKTLEKKLEQKQELKHEHGISTGHSHQSASPSPAAPAMGQTLGDDGLPIQQITGGSAGQIRHPGRGLGGGFDGI